MTDQEQSREGDPAARLDHSNVSQLVLDSPDREPELGAHGASAGARAARPKANGAAGRPALVRTIETEIIPRLMLAHGIAPGMPTMPNVAVLPPSHDDMVEFARLCVHHGADAAQAFIDALLARGTDVDMVLMGVMAPAARYLGGQWEDDSLSFIDVTIGLSRMHQLMRALCAQYDCGHTLPKRRTAPKAVFSPVEGDQHSFGCAMACEVFRRAGWDVWGPGDVEPCELSAVAASQPITLFGLSAGSAQSLDRMADTIERLRRVSSRPDLLVMAGGPAFQQDPELALRLGASAVAVDAAQALCFAEAWLSASGSPARLNRKSPGWTPARSRAGHRTDHVDTAAPDHRDAVSSPR